MMIPHVVSTEADKVFVNHLNTQAVTVQAGDAVVWATSSPDGVRSTQPASTTLSLFIGINDADTAASAYGLVQSYGYRAAALVVNNTVADIAAGNCLIPVAAADQLAFSAAGDGKSGFAYAGEAFASSAAPAAALKKVFIRAL